MHPIDSFKADGNIRPTIAKVFRKNWVLLASDSFTLIGQYESNKTPLYEYRGEVIEDPKMWDMLYKYFDEWSNSLQDIGSLGVEATKIILETYKTADELDYRNQAKCDVCHGDGESYCSCCENTSECKKCDGTRSIWRPIKTGNKTFPWSVFLGLGKYTINAEYLERVVNTAKAYGHDRVDVHECTIVKDKAIMFSFPDVFILVMPVRSEDTLHNFL